MKIGKRILELRKKQNITQEQLAEKLDVTRQTISNWELGITKPDIEQIIKISNIFKISIDELLGQKTNNIILSKAIVEKIKNAQITMFTASSSCVSIFIFINAAVIDLIFVANKKVIITTNYNLLIKKD